MTLTIDPNDFDYSLEDLSCWEPVKRKGRPPMIEKFFHIPINNDVIVVGEMKGAWLGEFEEDI